MKSLFRRCFVAVLAFVSIVMSVNAQTRTATFAITNAQVVTVSGPNLSRATVVVRDGLIEAVGENVKVPADARVIDGSGLIVYPGFFDANTSLGLAAPVAPRPAGQGLPTTPTQSPSNSNYPDGLQPEESAIERLKSGEAQFETNRNAGFTTVLTVSRDGVFNGQSALINLAGDSVSEMIIRAPFAEHFSFTTLRTGQYPTALLGTFSALRQMLLDAQRLQANRLTYDKNPRGMKRPEADKSLDALLPVLSRTMPIVFNANTEIEIIRALDLAKEFNLNAIISGGQEAGKVADRLKAQNVPVLLSLNFPKRTTTASPEADAESLDVLRLRAETPKTAGKLAGAGVKFAFQSGGMTSIGDFATNANKAVENGLTKDAAIRAMTLSAAEIFGVSDRLGSIEKGKIANLTVSRGDILSKDKTITHVFVDGKLFEQKEKPKTPTPTTGGTQPAATASVGGNYSITVEIPGQPLPGTLSLTQQGEILTGNLQTQLATTPIKDGKVTAEGFNFTTTVEFGGSTFDLFVSGKVTGNQISGTMTSPQGAIPFSGTKIP
ncbi:MAG: amidohydrolase family protein [Pyrinomonadaceae bacterium]|nr:amidohydrolase family protein [Pyrinomonadaceae bacterium]